jgi:hypothetical protein
MKFLGLKGLADVSNFIGILPNFELSSCRKRFIFVYWIVGTQRDDLKSE